MGGFGSGRQGWKGKVQHCRSLDANKMNRAGAFKPGHSVGWEWKDEGKRVSSISLSSTGHALSLNFRYRRNDDDWETVEQKIAILWSPCRYGGERAYFRCPGVVNGFVCRRRVVKLYMGGKYFLCRHCYNLAYASQSDDRHDRLTRRANKRRMALGGEPGVNAWIRKPKGMWQRTYDRHRAEILSLEEQSVAEFLNKYARYLRREELEMYFE